MFSAAIARAAIAPLFTDPTLRAEQSSQLVLGEAAEILASDGEWRRLRARNDGYEGWTHVGYLVEVDGAAADAWKESADGWSLGAAMVLDEGSLRLPLRARVLIDGEQVKLPDGRRGRLAEGQVAGFHMTSRTAMQTPVHEWARLHFPGSPYQWGGVTPWGVDCSGLVQTSFLARGVCLPRDSSQQVGCGAAIEMESPRPGDLLFFRGESTPSITHVAIAGDAGTLVHSTVACGGVVSESWLPGTRAASLRARLVAVRRVGDG